MDRITSMEVFVCAAEKGGFTAAARELRLSPTMVGKHIRSLEDRLGLRLLNRTTRRQSLTEGGALFLKRAKQVLADLAAVETGVQELHEVPRGLLRIASPVTFGVQRLTPMIADFQSEHPQVRVELELSDRTLDLVEDGFDAAICIGDLRDSNLIGRRLRPYRMLLCASPQYLAQNNVPKKPADLRSHNCLAFAYWDKKNRWRLLGPKGTRTVEVAGNFSVNHGFALRAAALAGQGIVMQPEVLLSDDIAAGRLVQVLPRYAPRARPMHLVYLADKQMTPKLRSFINFAVERFS